MNEGRWYRKNTWFGRLSMSNYVNEPWSVRRDRKESDEPDEELSYLFQSLRGHGSSNVTSILMI